MTDVPWRDGARELRRLVTAEGGDPERITDAAVGWRAFRAFLAVPLEGLFDRWENPGVEADMLLVDFGFFSGPGERPSLPLTRRFSVQAGPWVDGVPGERSAEDDPLGLDLAETVQVELELGFAAGVDAEAEEFWTAARSGDFAAADPAEADGIIASLGLGRPLSSRIELVKP